MTVTPSNELDSTVGEGKQLSISAAKAKNSHFWSVALPAVRLIVLAFMFAFFGVIQSARAYTVIGSVFGAFIFSVAGVSFWVGCQGLSEAYASVKEKFPEPITDKLKAPQGLNTDGLLAVITTYRIIEDKYVEYKMEVNASGKEWFVWRRYSDFYRTFQENSEFAKNMASAKLPPKKWFANHRSSTFIADRIESLNEYLMKLLKEHGERRADHAIVDFFGLDM